MSSESLYIGNYCIVKELSSGAFGDVYLAQHLVLTNRIVAIKLLRSIHLESDQAITRFLREAQLLEKLKHPHILPVIDVGVYKKIPYMVTEYASKGSLRDRLIHRAPTLLPFQECLTILEQVGKALQYAHQQNIIHRDIKPENILFNDRDEVLLADFGLATVVDSSSLKHTGGAGTITYMAPEQFQDTICKESDQYALACVAYELFTGHQPFVASNIASFITKCLLEEPEPLRKYNPHVPESVEQAVLKALSKERTKRHENITDFIEALKRSPYILSWKEREQWINILVEKMTSSHISKQIIVTECNKILQVDSTFTDVYYFKGAALGDLKKYEEALVAFDIFTSNHPYYSQGWLCKSNILKCVGRDEEAAAAYIVGKRLEEIEQKEGDKDEFENGLESLEANKYYDIGRVFFDDGNYVNALSSLELATALNFNHTAAWEKKGLTYLVLGQSEKALEAFTRVIQIDPYNLNAYTNMAILYGFMDQYDAVLEVLNIAIKLDENYLPASSFKAATLFQLNRYQEALVLYEKCIDINPNNSDLWYGKGVVLEELGRFEEALIAQNRTISLDNTNIEAYKCKTNLLTNLERISEALDTVNQALQISSDDFIFYEIKASLLLRMKYYEEAFYASESALRLAPDSSEAHWLNGWASYFLNQHYAAFRAFDKATQLNPSDARYWECKGMMLQELGRIQEAKMAYEVANKLAR